MSTGTKRQEQGAELSGGAPEKVQSPLAEGVKDGLTGPEAPINGRQLGDGRRQGYTKYVDEEQLARGLGWFSIGLGLAELLAPRGIARVAGLRGNTGSIRLFGLREIASGIAIFTQGRRPAGAVWSRVAGDALDLACLGAAFASPRLGQGAAHLRHGERARGDGARRDLRAAAQQQRRRRTEREGHVP